MGKGANKHLLENAGTGQQEQKRLSGQSSSLYGFLDPTLQAEATNPQGYSEGDKNAMRTASEQSLGGSTAGITGQANLEAARTRNAGGFQGAIGEGSRANARQLSQNAVEIEANNARLKEQQKQTALSSLERLYGVDSATALNYLNSSNSGLGAVKSIPGFATAGSAFAQQAGKDAADSIWNGNKNSNSGGV